MLFHRRTSIGSLLFSFVEFSIYLSTSFRRPNAPSVRELTSVPPGQRKWERSKMSLIGRLTPPRASPTSGGIRWSMVISHHPPCDYDRTFKIASIRICTRCFGVLLGLLTSVLLQVDSHVLASIIPIWASFLLPLPAVIDFTAHELEWWRSNNAKRLATGLLLGFAVGVGGYNIFAGYISLGFLQITWLGILEFGAALILRHCGQLESYVMRYEKSVRKGLDEFIKENYKPKKNREMEGAEK